jgi:hypothetical protein
VSTKERYGTMVWSALVDLTDNRVGYSHKWVSVGEVANKAQVSLPTAKKYLLSLWEMGHASCAMIDHISGFRANVHGR